MDVDDRRRRQSAEIKLIGPSGEVQLSIATSGSSKGQEIRLVFDRTRRLLKPFDSLGLLSPQLRVLRELAEVHQRHGIVLIGAAPGQGLSTSAYSFVGRHDAYTSNIKTLEGEILSRIDGVDHLFVIVAVFVTHAERAAVNPDHPGAPIGGRRRGRCAGRARPGGQVQGGGGRQGDRRHNPHRAGAPLRSDSI